MFMTTCTVCDVDLAEARCGTLRRVYSDSPNN